uniref:SAM domain-containing protein n=1 Tax=Panagrolaimus sp. ES5 TaxID=591445 RepID=A0AC34GUU7_9BILA
MNENAKHFRKIKKVNVPMVPEISTTNDMIESAFNSSNTTDYHTDSGSNASDRNSFYTNSSAPLPGISPTPSRAESLFDSAATVASFTDDDYSCSETVAVASNPMSRSCSTMMQHANSYGSIPPNYSIASTESYHSSGFNSRARSHYPTAGSSNSLSSTNINNQRSTSSSCMNDKKNSHYNGNNNSRSSSTICPPGSSVPYRLARPIRNNKNWHKVAEMITKGVSEMEVLADWLNSLGFSNYLQLFVSQGYDLASIARVTPQDLIALGITQPNHRRQLIQDIHQWNITDGYPSYVPSSNGIRDFLSAIGLSQYIELFESQKYNTIKDLEELSWEDLEDVGVKKLGHMKRLCIALKKLKTNREARQKKNSEAASSSEGNYQQTNDYPTSTLTSRSSTALGDHGSFESGCNTLRKPSRMSMPEQRQRPIAPVFPSHHVSTSSENIKLSSKDIMKISECESPTIESQKEHHFSLDTRKPAKLNLITKDQILSKLDDIENDDVLSVSVADDIPPSPAPISCNSALERIYAIKNHRPSNNFDMYQGNYQFINGSNGLPVTSHLRYHHNEEPYINDMEHLNDLGQMLRDLTDELDAKLNPCGSTAV